jgi:phosphopentomutase
MTARRAAIIVLDGMGIGPAPDTAAYGDTGSNTLGNVLAGAGLDLPNLTALGLGSCVPLDGVPPAARPGAAYGTAQPASAGKDSTTGHWEICGVLLETPFPTYPHGFPDTVIAEFSRLTGRGVLGNRASSGTVILDELGAEHVRTGKWIVYTSADSVFQVAAHQDVVPLEELYEACRLARAMLVGEHGVSRVIARPFVGSEGHWVRTPNRRDYSVEPVGETLLDRLASRDIPRLGVGKVDDLFAARNIASTHTPTNEAAYQLIEQGLQTLEHGLLFANVIEFDQSWGHRNDVAGFRRGLVELDAAMPRLVGGLREADLVIFTADHGNDPTTRSTDHAREVVPLLVAGPRVRPVPLGRRATFADIGQTVAHFFDAGTLAAGTSFLDEVWT